MERPAADEHMFPSELTSGPHKTVNVTHHQHREHKASAVCCGSVDCY